jgi:hypothetical protein
MKTLIFNKCGKGATDTLFIDLDIPFNEFNATFKYPYERLLELVLGEYGFNVLFKQYTESRNGYTHLTLVIDTCVNYEKALILKFLLGDDRNRITLQLWRLRTIGNPLDYFNGSHH